MEYYCAGREEETEQQQQNNLKTTMLTARSETKKNALRTVREVFACGCGRGGGPTEGQEGTFGVAAHYPAYRMVSRLSAPCYTVHIYAVH